MKGDRALNSSARPGEARPAPLFGPFYFVAFRFSLFVVRSVGGVVRGTSHTLLYLGNTRYLRQYLPWYAKVWCIT